MPRRFLASLAALVFSLPLAAGWLERGGDWKAVRGMVDILATSARVVVDDIRGANARLGFLIDVAVSRALIVVELALGGLLADRLRVVDAELVELYTAHHGTIEQATEDSALDAADRSSERFDSLVDRPTVPLLRPDRAATGAGEPADVLAAIGQVITLARGRISPRARLLEQVLGVLETVVGDGAGNFSAAVLGARELYGVRSVDHAGTVPLFDALDQARILVASSVHQLRTPPGIRARALRALSTAHQRLVGATTGLVLEAVMPFTDRLREAQAVTTELRDAMARAERRRADLERRFATIVDPSLPWGARSAPEG